MTEKPLDIQNRPWTRRTSEAWTTASLRAQVLTFIGDYVAARSWLTSWDVVECFVDGGINVKVPRTPPVQPAEDDFQQRPGLRLLKFGVTRKRDSVRLEVAVDFRSGVITTDDVARALQLVSMSLDAEHRRRPLP